MPKAVVLLASDDPKKNLSDEAYAAFGEPAVSIDVSLITGHIGAKHAGTGQALKVVDSVEPMVYLAPHPHVHRPPTDVTIKESLGPAEVDTMLADQVEWKLAVPSGTSTNVLTRAMLKEADDTAATGTVTKQLRATTEAEQALLADASERLSPKGSATRFAAALGAPVTNIALVAAAAAAFVGFKPDQPIARSSLLVIGGLCALVSVIGSLVSTAMLRRVNVNLSRLDLLEMQKAPAPWLPNLWAGLFVLALISAFFSVVPGSPHATTFPTFSQPTTEASGQKVDAGTPTKTSFTVAWTALSDMAKKVRTVVSGGGVATMTVTTPKSPNGTSSQAIMITVNAPATLTVATQATDSAANPVGDQVIHTYAIK